MTFFDAFDSIRILNLPHRADRRREMSPEVPVQLTAEHWFYLYIVWFLPLLLVAIAAGRDPDPAAG